MMILYGGYLILALDSLPGSSHPLLPSSCVIINHVPVILDSLELYNHYLTIKIIIYLLNIFPHLQQGQPSRSSSSQSEGSGRIENSFPLETWAQGSDLNPEPESLRAAFPHFPGVKPLQAEAKNDGPNDEASQTKGIIAPNVETIKVPNGGYTSGQSRVTPRRRHGPAPEPMTTALKQDNQVANSRFLTNERTPSLSAILPPLNPSTQIPQAHISQYPEETPVENLSLEVGCYIDPRTLRSKFITIFE
ncbi:hypothetical protein DSO57_1017111 [Entomophthora muscae]|uniref:Uncharacterized protein n=1 Tax=Entomophthora muscae TaxID=34485 RepID=A0ACC2UEP9_9FUNG|nr:hypothetical protein DSO57_1017111 [Entomophthora muscae]